MEGIPLGARASPRAGGRDSRVKPDCEVIISGNSRGSGVSEETPIRKGKRRERMALGRSWVGGLIGCALGSLCATVAGLASDEKPAAVSPQAAELFEAHVRPVLAENCFSCHGPERQMAGLRLDSRAGLLKGSAHGLVLVAGDPEKSALIRAIRYGGAI